MSKKPNIKGPQSKKINFYKICNTIQGDYLCQLLQFPKAHYFAFIQSALLKHLCKDNIVYHGLADHFLVKDTSHVLKVRIFSDMNKREKLVSYYT